MLLARDRRFTRREGASEAVQLEAQQKEQCRRYYRKESSTIVIAMLRQPFSVVDPGFRLVPALV